MQGDPAILEALNEVLTAELTAINQYFIHAKMCEDWGYQRLYKKKREESIEEMHDADKVIERILYLDGIPNMQRLFPIGVGEDAVEQHELDLALETAAIELARGAAPPREGGGQGGLPRRADQRVSRGRAPSREPRGDIRRARGSACCVAPLQGIRCRLPWPRSPRPTATTGARR
jgi:bacterioferritin